MIGLLIVTHSGLGKEFLNAAEFIVGRLDAADAVSITLTADSEQIRKMIEEKVSALDTGEGVLILTDMLGGTPSNISLSFLKEEMVEVLTGVNLPMVIAIAQNRADMDLNKLAEMAQEAGKTSISLASKLLESE
jgi:PTS system mannose-specific IIA component